ncbi:MAG: hypothetical protein PVF26_05375 [Desulfobacterales bacterium]
MWRNRPAGTHGHPHTVVNERLHRHALGVSFFAPSQDEQAGAHLSEACAAPYS